MNEADALEMMQSALMTVLIVSGPVVGAAMLVGILVSLVQALTQIQESTLTFVPKIVAMLAALGLAAPFIGSKIHTFTQLVYSRIETGF
jgi:flagellar biosynthesis protein FliQ